MAKRGGLVTVWFMTGLMTKQEQERVSRYVKS